MVKVRVRVWFTLYKRMEKERNVSPHKDEETNVCVSVLWGCRSQLSLSCLQLLNTLQIKKGVVSYQ